jgi:hypothetical protein
MKETTDTVNPNTNLLAKLASVSGAFDRVRTEMARDKRFVHQDALFAGVRNALARRGVLVAAEIADWKAGDPDRQGHTRQMDVLVRVTLIDSATGERLVLMSASTGTYQVATAVAQAIDVALKNCFANLLGLAVDPAKAFVTALNNWGG